MPDQSLTVLEKVVALAKRRGLIYQGSEIYGGLAGTWDYGPLGVALKNNLKNLWWRHFVTGREDMYGLDAAIIMNPKTWEASGHAAGFADPLTVDGKTEKFNTMFKTQVGATGDEALTSYLRPETAQGMFVNFKNVVDSFHPKLPFGLGQIGKAFRNEIAPRDFVFRSREFEQLEVEYFVRPTDWEKQFEEWRQVMWQWIELIGLPKDLVHELEVPETDRAHYSKRTIDFEFDYPFGRKELYGLAYRGDYDLAQHQAASKVDLTYFDEETKERFLPHVIEPSLGLDRTILALLTSAYTEDDPPAGGGDEVRVYLKLKPEVAPITVAVFPLLKNKPDLVAKAREIFSFLKVPTLRSGPRLYVGTISFDDNGNIGKRYRRQDEIGTPYCVTIDFQTLEDGTVTLRHRDTGEQERLAVSALIDRLS
ncbi:MAG: glycine--tRNA ligase [Patescibacteria group bacterium]